MLKNALNKSALWLMSNFDDLSAETNQHKWIEKSLKWAPNLPKLTVLYYDIPN